ncbi:Winged helix-turn-helix transcription repressor DNA-binding [Penicillium coprophilum]|uniref:Winged helix-turn-helix transcription repressor DNA-binding n=1 Tax=Penicillium coprophilum TaxID=36646 RepID=UPI0023A3803A|nr:Winged helix-turn-helix transcription repressor DNA-binding [Penicillium coprophilum]KAJ5154157.1 Winged helix-turn-helix transcription repressor DNA-binding [Penicillium coprophilum]
MPPKKVTSASKKAPPAHTSYRDMIKDAIISLKERNGSSRQAIKKYVQANNKINVTSQSVFDSQFNKAIKAGVEKNEFTQPKGPSGPLKLAKKDAPVKAAPKPAAAKPATKPSAKPAAKPAAAKPAAKKAAPKKAAPKTAAKTAAPKKTAAKKATATKPKANSGKARKTAVTAPAVVEQPKVLGKTKSGRITKTTAPQPTTTRAAPKKRTAKK